MGHGCVGSDLAALAPEVAVAAAAAHSSFDCPLIMPSPLVSSLSSLLINPQNNGTMAEATLTLPGGLWPPPGSLIIQATVASTRGRTTLREPLHRLDLFDRAVRPERIVRFLVRDRTRSMTFDLRLPAVQAPVPPLFVVEYVRLSAAGQPQGPVISVPVVERAPSTRATNPRHASRHAPLLIHSPLGLFTELHAPSCLRRLAARDQVGASIHGLGGKRITVRFNATALERRTDPPGTVYAAKPLRLVNCPWMGFERKRPVRTRGYQSRTA